MPRPQDIVDMEKNAENREYVLVEVAKKGALLEFASKELRNDKEVVLEEQAFIKENKITVSKYVSDNGGEILSMIRFAVGEGIEKKQENFAEEVMSQIKGA